VVLRLRGAAGGCVLAMAAGAGRCKGGELR